MTRKRIDFSSAVLVTVFSIAGGVHAYMLYGLTQGRNVMREIHDLLWENPDIDKNSLIAKLYMPSEEEREKRKSRRDEILALRNAREGTKNGPKFKTVNDFDVEFIEKI